MENYCFSHIRPTVPRLTKCSQLSEFPFAGDEQCSAQEHDAASTMQLTKISAARLDLGELLHRCRGFAESIGLIPFVGLAVLLTSSTAWSLHCLLLASGITEADRLDLVQHGAAGLFFDAVLIAPLAETLVLQQLPVVLAVRFAVPIEIQFLLASLPFGLLHFSSGIETGVSATFGGLVFATLYLSLFPLGKVKAFFTTAAVHLLHNFFFFWVYLGDMDQW